jgi:hypothetical protein
MLTTKGPDAGPGSPELASSTVQIGAVPLCFPDHPVSGAFVEIDGETFYRIEHYDRLPPFFISVVSAADHWLFISSNGALTAGRRSPDHPLFPYCTEDKIHDSRDITGSKTLILAKAAGFEGDALPTDDQTGSSLWEPFSDRHAGLYRIRRTLYKNLLGNIIRFEETNDDLGLTFTLSWATSEHYGFVRRCSLRNEGSRSWDIRLLDGIQNIMPYGVTKAMQSEKSVLIDAYKKNELVQDVGLGLFTLSAQPVDRPEPSEALKASTVWSAGLQPSSMLLCSRQVDGFRSGGVLETETEVRAQRGAYFVESRFDLPPGEENRWMIVADIDKDATDVVSLISELGRPSELAASVEADIRAGSERLRSIVGSSDGLQITEDRLTTARHYTNVLFNVMRGGVFDDNYRVDREDLLSFIQSFNAIVAQDAKSAFDRLPPITTRRDVMQAAKEGGPQLERLCLEYLPLIFSRRHGDPSRPWNHFRIDLRAEDGSVRRGYEGNWRDIFQNWEALGRSFPGYLESMIAKFVNASTADGYNPYRITNRGIDWEVTDPDDPWSFIGYWGDHQIIYSLALLRQFVDHYPERLPELLSRRLFAYANVPYRIKPYEDLLRDPHATIDFDDAKEKAIEERVAEIGADGKLLWRDGEVVLVPLAEKLLVPVLAKLTNFIPGGGIWLNTQRPEWNDANNALVGFGMSMVTLFQLRDYLAFMRSIVGDSSAEAFEMSSEVAALLANVDDIFERFGDANDGTFSGELRKELVDALGQAGSVYRTGLYDRGLSGETSRVDVEILRSFISRAMAFLDGTIEVNRREDGLYHSYNLLTIKDDALAIDHLYPMLEGQVAALSAGILSAGEALDVITSLRQSPLYRADQHSYILYPDRKLPGFLQKNTLPEATVGQSRLLQHLIADGDRRLVSQDKHGDVHFNGAFRNKRDVEAVLNDLADSDRENLARDERDQILDVFEKVFDHRSYTGRSGTFFGYEGLGSIYWHMVSKLVLAVQKNVFEAHDAGVDLKVIRDLVEAYYDVRAGLGTHKTPENYGAFPTDPYSHTPAHAGAKQPGMTGQVKEDILCRWGELGIRVKNGAITIDPVLLRESEFLSEPRTFEYIDISGDSQELALEPGSLAFTYCQTPFLYSLAGNPAIRIIRTDGSGEAIDGNTIPANTCAQLFERKGTISRIEVDLTPGA